MVRVFNSMLAAVAATSILIPTLVWAQEASPPEKYTFGPHMMWWGGGWSGMIFAPLFMILMVALVLAAAVLLVRWLGPWQRTTQAPPARTSLDILKERFARGEISKEEYQERRHVLGD
jgi:putative membrane protein